MSASVLDEDRIAVVAAGCDDFLPKPFQEHAVFALLHKHLGVRFVYAEGEEQHDAGQAVEQVLTPQAFAALPKDLVIELEQAVDALNLEAVHRAILQIQPQNEPLANALQKLVKSYRFDTLQAWLKNGDQE